MAIFGVLVDRWRGNSSMSKYLKDVKEKFKGYNVVTNPFKANIKSFIIDDKTQLIVFDILPLYFSFSIFGWIGAASLFFITGSLTWWILPFLLIGCLGIFWRREFFFYMFKLGLQKKGYAGSISLVGPEKVVQLAIFENKEGL